MTNEVSSLPMIPGSHGKPIRLQVEVPESVTEDLLCEHFQRYARVTEVSVCRGEGKGFFLVHDASAARVIMAQTHDLGDVQLPPPRAVEDVQTSSDQEDQKIVVEEAETKEMDQVLPINDRKLFIGGLSFRTDETKLRAHFKQFGEMTDVVVLRQSGGQTSRCFGFVTFADPAAAERALVMRFQPIGGRYVEVKPAVPREVVKVSSPPWRKMEAHAKAQDAKTKYSASPVVIPAGVQLMPTLMGYSIPNRGAPSSSTISTRPTSMSYAPTGYYDYAPPVAYNNGGAQFMVVNGSVPSDSAPNAAPQTPNQCFHYASYYGTHQGHPVHQGYYAQHDTQRVQYLQPVPTQHSIQYIS